MALGVPLGIVVGLALALLLDAAVRGLAAYRTLFYLPAIVPAVAASILWLWVFHPTGGLMNALMAVTGLNNYRPQLGPGRAAQVAAAGEPRQARPDPHGPVGRRGQHADLAGRPQEHPGGALRGRRDRRGGPLRRFRYVTLPMLTPYIFFNLIMGTIGVFQVFTQAYIMTEGGPNDSTLFYAYNLFNQAFRYLRMGYASALAWVLFAIIMVLTLIQMKTSKRWVHYETP